MNPQHQQTRINQSKNLLNKEEKKGSFLMEKVKQSDFRMSILASGSTGNSVYVETDRIKILVDAGLSGKKIENLLER